MQSVPLVVVEEAASAAERKIGEAAVDAPAAKRELIGISEINLAAVVKARRAQNEFPAANARAPDGDGDENRRVVELLWSKKLLARVRKLSASRVQPRKGIVTPNWCSSSPSP